MANIKIIERAIKSYIEGDNKLLIETIEEEIVNAKKNGRHAVVKRLRDLLKLIPNKQHFVAQSSSNSLVEKENPLIERIKSEVLLESVILDESTKQIVNSLLTEWDKYETLIQHNIAPANKLLFYGPPGTGKTMLAYGLANKLDMPLILVRLDELISSYLGKTGKNIREIFNIAEKENVIIFLDEIDTIAKNRDDDRELGELKRIVTVLLQNIDSFPFNSILIGATNHESILDKAIWRRFTIKIRFESPSKAQRTLLFRQYLCDFNNDIDFDLIADLSEGLNGSTISDICTDIKKRAILNGSKIISTTDAINVILLMGKFANTQIKIPKKKYYDMCKIMKKHGYTLKQIESISGIPYTTLVDNIR